LKNEADKPILDVRDLVVRFYTDEGVVWAVNGVSFKLLPGRSIGIVGESGCGKSVSAFAVLRLLPATAAIPSGQILFRRRDGSEVDLARVGRESQIMHSVRGGEIAMIFQEPMSALSPVHTISNQLVEAIRFHQKVSPQEARDRAIGLLQGVGIPDAADRIDDYSFQFSGGMRQRAFIAMALACNPRIVIADEPTTALDVTIQAQVLGLIKRMQDELNLSLILITHDLGVIAHMVDYVYVLYLGRVVEEGPVISIFGDPQHPYTRDLLQSIPRLSGDRSRRISSIEGSVPDAYRLPSGCAFHGRCRRMLGDICRTKVPAASEVGPNHKACCFLHSKKTVDDYAHA
jgi:peptide/nickel transport system ATP-binding protein